MSIASIRQRKLFKNPNRSLLLNRLLTDPNTDDHFQTQPHILHLKTEQSSASDHDHDNILSCYRNTRESLCSRPTLQHHNNHSSNHVGVVMRQLNNLQDKVIKQQAITEKCFQQMEKLDKEHQIIKMRLKQKYEAKQKTIKDRIDKQKLRNNKYKQVNIELIDKIVNRLEQHQRNNKQNIKQLNSKTFVKQFLQLISFELNRKQINLQSNRQTNYRTSPKPSQRILQNKLQQGTTRKGIMDSNSKIDISLNLEIKISGESRQSESILLDDSI